MFFLCGLLDEKWATEFQLLHEESREAWDFFRLSQNLTFVGRIEEIRYENYDILFSLESQWRSLHWHNPSWMAPVDLEAMLSARSSATTSSYSPTSEEVVSSPLKWRIDSHSLVCWVPSTSSCVRGGIGSSSRACWLHCDDSGPWPGGSLGGLCWCHMLWSWCWGQCRGGGSRGGVVIVVLWCFRLVVGSRRRAFLSYYVFCGHCLGKVRHYSLLWILLREMTSSAPLMKYILMWHALIFVWSWYPPILWAIGAHVFYYMLPYDICTYFINYLCII